MRARVFALFLVIWTMIGQEIWRRGLFDSISDAVLVGILGLSVMLLLFWCLTYEGFRRWIHRGGVLMLGSYMVIGGAVGVGTGYSAWFLLKSKAERQIPLNQLRDRAEDVVRTLESIDGNYRQHWKQQEDRYQSQVSGSVEPTRSRLRAEHEREDRGLTDNYVHDFATNYAPSARDVLRQISERPELRLPKEGRRLAEAVFKGKRANPDSIREATKYLRAVVEQMQ